MHVRNGKLYVTFSYSLFEPGCRFVHETCDATLLIEYPHIAGAGCACTDSTPSAGTEASINLLGVTA